MLFVFFAVIHSIAASAALGSFVSLRGLQSARSSSALGWLRSKPLVEVEALASGEAATAGGFCWRNKPLAEVEALANGGSGSLVAPVRVVGEKVGSSAIRVESSSSGSTGIAIEIGVDAGIASTTNAGS